MATIAPAPYPTQASATAIPFHADSPRWQSAIRKAERIAANAPFVFGDGGTYLVLGTNENHTVRVLDGAYLCDCAASQFGIPCVHSAGVVLKLQSRLAAIVAPKPAPKIYNCAKCGAQNVDPLHDAFGCEF